MKESFDYGRHVIECYEKGKDLDIHNASEKNALLLFKTLFKKAIKDKKDIKIISNKLLARFYNQLTSEVEEVFNNGNTVKVIVETEVDDKDNNKFYQKIKCQKATDNVLSAAKKFKGLPNFIVVGNNAFRYETDKNSTKAIANFNNKSLGECMAGIFDNLSTDIRAV